ncbi:DUF6489 family protein [uncultured Erythrobacter sp.]|uniref:DUF6489 family protein n=1 Tax=uncultured Erythrobacter sp. TaxID=263913 RepID=UPI002621B2BE|nr:DUF6489 family protein [uncultured Erythrobacter sp.]
MKINVEVDCTPQEAREFLGLPDVSEANNLYVDNITKAMQGVQNPAQLQEYAQALAPMGQMGLKMFQSFVEGGMRAAGGSSRSKSKSDD